MYSQRYVKRIPDIQLEKTILEEHLKNEEAMK